VDKGRPQKFEYRHEAIHADYALRPALVQRGDELRETGGALDDVRAGLADKGEELLAPRLHP
jgi:hypothetical protein